MTDFMSRREFLLGITRYVGRLAAVPLAVGVVVSESGCSNLVEVLERSRPEETLTVAEQRRRIRILNTDNSEGSYNKKLGYVPFNLSTIVKNLTRGLPHQDGRAKLFEFVRSFPYEVMKSYQTVPTELLAYERGDCRHKSCLLKALLSEYGERVEETLVLFDWKDLPINDSITDLLKKSGTKGIHRALRVYVEGRWVDLEPSWDSGLKHLGFPVNENWDGKSKMHPVTIGETKVYGEQWDLTRVSEAHGIHYDEEEKLRFFNELNKFLRTNRKHVAEYDEPLPAELLERNLRHYMGE